MPLLYVAVSDILSPWFGESERMLHLVFETARQYAPCILFIDEVDAALHTFPPVAGTIPNTIPYRDVRRRLRCAESLDTWVGTAHRAGSLAEASTVDNTHRFLDGSTVSSRVPNRAGQFGQKDVGEALKASLLK